MSSEAEREAWMHARWEIAYDPNASAPVAVNPEPSRELPPLIYYRADHLATCPNMGARRGGGGVVLPGAATAGGAPAGAGGGMSIADAQVTPTAAIGCGDERGPRAVLPAGGRGTDPMEVST